MPSRGHRTLTPYSCEPEPALAWPQRLQAPPLLHPLRCSRMSRAWDHGAPARVTYCCSTTWVGACRSVGVVYGSGMAEICHSPDISKDRNSNPVPKGEGDGDGEGIRQTGTRQRLWVPASAGERVSIETDTLEQLAWRRRPRPWCGGI